MTGRSQYVIYDGIKSETKVVECGVPQGSVLGLLVFIISMNATCIISDLMFVIMYADDTCYLINGTDMKKLIKQLNVELESLCIWFKSNTLSLNTQKKLLHGARLKTIDNSSIDILIDNQILSSQFNYLSGYHS